MAANKKKQSFSEWLKQEGYGVSQKQAEEDERKRQAYLASQHRDDDIAPVKGDAHTSSGVRAHGGAGGSLGDDAGEKKRTWIQKSDGNWWQTILGSGTDVAEHGTAGVLGMGEKIVDTLASIGTLIGQSSLAETATNEMLYNAYHGKEDENVLEKYESAKKEIEERNAEFIAKDLYDEEAIAKTIISAPMRRKYGIDSESQSIFGEKSDELAMSAGQLGAQIGVNVLLPGSGLALMGASSFGSEAESALRNGATFGDAVLSASISTAGELITEKLGGINFGGKTLTDAVFGELSSKVTGKFAKALVSAGKLATDATFEAAEEVVSGYIQAWGQSISYMDDKEISELFTKEDALDAAIGGFVLGGAFSGVEAAIKGGDTESGLNKDEQSVIDRVVNDTIKAKEKSGEKLTSSDKRSIRKQVQKDMESGSLDPDVLDEMFSGDAYQEYRDAVYEEDQARFEYEILGDPVVPTPESQARWNELDAIKDSFMSRRKSNALRSKMEAATWERLKDTRLAETLRERTLSRKLFSGDPSSHKSESAQRTVENIVNSGLMNDTRRAHEMADNLVKFAEARNVTFDLTDGKTLREQGKVYTFKKDIIADGESDVFSLGTRNIDREFKPVVTVDGEEARFCSVDYDAGKIYLESPAAEGSVIHVEYQKVAAMNGSYDKNSRVITINMDSPDAWQVTVGHEITHNLEGTDAYEEYQAAVKAYAEKTGEYESLKNAVSSAYNDGTDIDSEVTAILTGEYLFTDQAFVEHLAATDRNLFQRIFDEIKHLFKMVTAGSKEARELEKAKHAFEKAYRAQADAIASSQADANADASANVDDANADADLAYSIRKEDPPTETGIAYKVFYVKDGKLYPPMVANPDGADTPMGVWLNADVGASAPPSKTGRAQVKAGGKGTQGGSGSLAFRPGWHLGDLPRASQFDRVNPETGKKELFPENFVWAEVEYAKDVDYQEEAMSYGYTENGKFRHAYAGLPRLPENGYYRYRTNPKPDTVPWVITGAMKVNRLLSDAEVNAILEENGVPAVHRQGGDVGLDKFGFDESGKVQYSLDKYTQKQYNNFGWARDTGAITKNELDDLYSKAQEKRSLKKFSQSANGEAIIEVNDDPHANLKVNNVFAFVKGTVSEPEITRVVRVNAFDEESLADFRKDIYGSTSKRAIETYARIVGEEFVQYYDRSSVANYGEYTQRTGSQQSGSESERNTGVNRNGNLRRTTFAEAETNEITSNKETSSDDGVFFDGEKTNHAHPSDDIAPTADVQYSISYDSEGNRLTEEQQEYFKDAKVRDRKENLLVMYHGTKEDFTVYDRSRLDDGLGFFFTEDKREASEYGTPKAAYLNIRNPFEMFGDTPIEDFLGGAPKYVDGHFNWEAARRGLIDAGYDGVYSYSHGTKWYIAFYPEQIKDITNKTPTSDPDIRYSLSKEDDIAPIRGGDWRTPVRDLRYSKTEDVAPIAEVDANKNILPDDYFSPVTEEMANQRQDGILESLGDAYAPREEDTAHVAGEDVSAAQEGVGEAPFPDAIAPMTEEETVVQDAPVDDIKITTAKERIGAKLSNTETEIERNKKLREEAKARYEEQIAALQEQYDSKKNKNTKTANNILRKIERLRRLSGNVDADYAKRISDLEARIQTLNNQMNQDHTKADRLELAYARIDRDLEQRMAELDSEFAQRRAEMEESLADRNAFISAEAGRLYDELASLRKGVRASKELGYLLDHGFDWKSLKAALVNVKRSPGAVWNVESEVEPLVREAIAETYDARTAELDGLDSEYAREVEQLEADAKAQKTAAREQEEALRRAEVLRQKLEEVNALLHSRGFDLDVMLDNPVRQLSTLETVDTMPQRVLEKTFGYEEGQALSDATVNKIAQNEAAGLKWLDSITNRKNGLLAQLSKQYHIKRHSKEIAAAMMYGEGSWVDEETGEEFAYGDAELAQDFPDVRVQNNIKALVADPRIRQFYDETLDLINAERRANGYPEIPKRANYFLHYREMGDFFTKFGLPFNPNDMRAKDLPTDMVGQTADLKPGQPFFTSSWQRKGKKTSYDLFEGIERYANSAKNQIFHIGDIQTLRALHYHLAERYGQAHGLENLDKLTPEQASEQIKKVYGSHLSTFAAFLDTEANILAGKTSMIDRALSEGVLGRRILTFMDALNQQTGAAMVGYNVSSANTNWLPVVREFANANPADSVKALAQTVANIASRGKFDSFREDSTVYIRRRGADRFNRKLWQKLQDPAYAMMGAVDSISTEIIARTEYNKAIRKGMSAQEAHYESDKKVSRLMADRSLGQMPQMYTSRMIGLLTKFQLEVRNDLDSMFYDTLQEEKLSHKDIENTLERNAKTAAKVAWRYGATAIALHAFGQAFEAVAGYNPAFDIIEAISKAFGWDDDEDDEDTWRDNLGEGAMSLIEDLPYASIFLDGGRIPISSALPDVKGIITGKDEYGNEKTLGDSLMEIAPYMLPAGGNQIKKTVQGLNMFSDEHPVSGSYTDSGNLRFPVEDTLGNRVQAAVFGQYANKNAREYFDNDYAPLSEKQTQEYIDVDMPIKDYWEYREGLNDLAPLPGYKSVTLNQKGDYVGSLDLSARQKNILINNIADDRSTPIDMTTYGSYKNFEEFDFAQRYPEKYEVLKEQGISVADYKKNHEESAFLYTDDYSWAADNPDKYMLSKVITDDVTEYKRYTSELNNIKGENKKEDKRRYIFSLDIDYGAKCVLFKSQYNADDTYNRDIVNYLNNRSDLTYEERVAILTELGFRVVNGQIYAD